MDESIPGGEQIQSAGTVALLFEGTVADLAEPFEEHCPGQPVAGFALQAPRQPSQMATPTEFEAVHYAPPQLV
jgi:hypothetical protein